VHVLARESGDTSQYRLISRTHVLTDALWVQTVVDPQGAAGATAPNDHISLLNHIQLAVNYH
jgi:hypothetical protein